MHPHLNSQHLMLLLGGAVFVICVLMLGVYLVHKSLNRTLEPPKPKSPKVRVKDEAAFALVTLKAALTQLKAEQKVTQERLVAAERRAEVSTRKFELIAREIDYGLMIFDVHGFITFSNPMVRKLLAVDTWSRRLYGEIFHDLPALSYLIGDCLATGTETRKRRVTFQGSDGNTRRLEVSVLETRDPSGVMESVACVFRELAAPVPDAEHGVS